MPLEITSHRSPYFHTLCHKNIPTFDVFTCLRPSCEYTAGQSYAMVPRWRIFGDFLCPVFSASRVQHTSDLHSKFALRPHHVWSVEVW